LRPFTFFSRVEAARATDVGRLDALAVEDRRCRLRLASLGQNGLVGADGEEPAGGLFAWTALDNGTAQPLSSALPDHICCAGTWWRPGAGGWTRVTEAGLVARLSAWATQMAAPNTDASSQRAGQPE